jgi:predicted dehydrogenase
MNQPIRIGVIGAGGNTRAKHLPGFRAIDGVSIDVVCNRTRASGEQVASEFGIGKVTTDWREIVHSPEIDAICVGTWPNLHAEITIAALRAGKHVLTEARMARDLVEAQQMLVVSREHPELVAQIVPAPMSLPFDATVIALLRAGGLGELREVIVTATSDALADSAQPLSWRQDANLNGKNTLTMGIYYETLLRWLNVGVSSVIADAAVFTPTRRNARGEAKHTTIPESITVLGAYANGARMVGHFSGVERGPRSEIRLHGSKASLRLDLQRDELGLTRQGEPERLVQIRPEDRGEWRVEADFVESIRTRRPVTLTNFQTGVDYMRFTEAVWSSWNHGGLRVTLS